MLSVDSDYNGKCFSQNLHTRVLIMPRSAAVAAAAAARGQIAGISENPKKSKKNWKKLKVVDRICFN